MKISPVGDVSNNSVGVKDKVTVRDGGGRLSSIKMKIAAMAPIPPVAEEVVVAVVVVRDNSLSELILIFWKDAVVD